jgi:hypothetical protein
VGCSALGLSLLPVNSLRYTVRIRGDGTKEQFAEIHDAVIATSPNFYNLSRPVALKPTLVVA